MSEPNVLAATILFVEVVGRRGIGVVTGMNILVAQSATCRRSDTIGSEVAQSKPPNDSLIEFVGG
ncbi:hypothetical protein [Rhodopirellula halodulae]|uniref:hypothetical protein n=1 Tax=Rhodopirellula halodulae TaxID=2894198 RepID=UPI001E58772D|nr:hypothetical protein [Rhodopirellula sp. JC737]MCC9657723.1 hypothetical protein [Rhodopirellula sp. JC737]